MLTSSYLLLLSAVHQLKYYKWGRDAKIHHVVIHLDISLSKAKVENLMVLFAWMLTALLLTLEIYLLLWCSLHGFIPLPAKEGGNEGRFIHPGMSLGSKAFLFLSSTEINGP